MAPLEWPCPTFGCQGFLVTEEEPEHDARTFCTRHPDTSVPICGREVAWNALVSQWIPIEPFRGFRR